MNPTVEPTANVGLPKELSVAVLFLIASLAIGLIRAIFGLTQRLSGAPLILAALIVIAVFALAFFLVWRVSVGRNWARILLLILVLFGLPFAFLANLAELKQNILAACLSITIEILQLVGTALLFTRNSNRWFKKRQ
jgi:hypothetical protein